MLIFNRLEVHAVDHCNLACVGCNHASPFLLKNFYSPDDYIKWFDLLLKHNYNWGCLAISGGEPFLLKDKINNFCSVLKKRYGSPIQLYSNAFWVFEENYLDKYEEALSNIDDLQLSLYPSFVEKYGLKNIKDKEEEIRNRFKIKVFNSVPNGVKDFAKAEFYTEPQETNAQSLCAIKECTQLRPNGIIYRCPHGLYFGSAISTKQFEESNDIKFDLKTDLGKKDILKFATKWPLDNCSYCGTIENRIKFISWESIIQKTKVDPNNVVYKIEER